MVRCHPKPIKQSKKKKGMHRRGDIGLRPLRIVPGDVPTFRAEVDLEGQGPSIGAVGTVMSRTPTENLSECGGHLATGSSEFPTSS